MVAAIDIGNTNIHIGVYAADRLLAKKTVPVASNKLDRNIGQFLSLKKINGAAIASVIPRLTRRVVRVIKKCCGVQSLVVTHKLKLPVKLCYEPPETLGADRIANVVGGLALFRCNLIIIDFGTATTFDVVSSKGVYLGGAIMPGIGLSADMLADRTALLKKIVLKRPKGIIGKNTAECMLSGVVNGAAAAARGIIRSIRADRGRSFVPIATGGWGHFIVQCIPEIKHYEENIGLYGILKIYHDNAC
ncbi:MAG: type III pantothenate kinase [candidate division WOR-3 bacterium]|nr:MAG: type III pantothenate kinase [candidate division WOR-3 bacterium]